MPSPEFPPLLQEARRIAKEVAAPAAAEVDRGARFPHESLAALRSARLLSAAVPVHLGGAGLTLAELGAVCHALARGCASSAMVLAMHTIQVACIARHGAGSAFFEEWLQALAAEQWLLASMTSEAGTFGDTRTSVCAITPDAHAPARFRLTKDATTGSYCAQADALLVTARRVPGAAPGDQSLALIRRQDATLAQTGPWDTLGMRGTCSPSFRLEANAACAQILPADFADISALTMVAYSHVLWAALWSGIAADAHARAAAFVRGQARKAPGSLPPSALRLADLTTALQALRHHWQAVAQEVDALPAPPRGMTPDPASSAALTPVQAGGPTQESPAAAQGAASADGAGVPAAPPAAHPLASMGWALKLNGLKTSAAERAPAIVHGALQIVGILGYRNDTPFSLGRHYRDALSAALMVSNDRIATQSATMLLVFKDDAE